MATMSYPLLGYMKSGISVAQVKKLLTKNDCLSFPQLRSGLFPAANFDNLEKDETGMADAWLRDTACIGIILLSSGETETVAKATRGVITKLREVRESFENVINVGTAPNDNKMRPPVRYSTQESIPRYDWANAQNDALGYSLQLIGLAVQANLIELAIDVIATLDMVIEYLDAVSYWQDAESGHWEEVRKVNSSSVGTVVGGLRCVVDYVSDRDRVETLISNGLGVLKKTLPNESATLGLERAADAALIFLVEPQRVIGGRLAERIIESAQVSLMGGRGFRRYNGDSYWGPDYREHFLTSDRAADFSKPKDMARRNQYLFDGGEAQWTFFDPLVSAYYARHFQKSGEAEDAIMAQAFMVRALNNIVKHRNAETGKLVWRIPELFFIEKGEWVPNDHLGLLWGEANLLYGLNVYEEVFANKPIKA